MLLNKFIAFQIENTSEIKGGFRYTTTSQAAFERKRNTLQNKGKCLCITVVNSHYCIEW